MEFFLVTPHPDYTDAPRLLDFHNKINVSDFYQDRSYNMPKRTVIRVHPNEHMDFTDYIFQSVPLFTDKAIKVIRRFESEFLYKELILLSSQDGLDQLYYLPFFRRFQSSEVLGTASTHEITQSNVLPELWIPYPIPVFFVFLRHKCFLLMRLDLTESLLRNGIRGMALHNANVYVEG